jgi:hypothetical protein
VEVFDGDGTLLFGPTLTGPAVLYPGPAVSLAISPDAPDTMLAGDTRNYTALVTDDFANAIDTASVAYRLEPDSLGDMTGSVLTARLTGTAKVIASYGPISDTTGTLEILPGTLASWAMSGVPAGSKAGAGLPSDSVVLTGRDAFGNVAFTYVDSLYFATSDSAAILPATEALPYTLSLSDSGRVAFPGSSFTWFKAGVDTLHARGGGLQTSASLVIAPDTAVDFQLSAPDSVEAGVPFAIDAVGLVDQFGNPASGQISLGTSILDSAAPNGQLPNLPDLAAVNGSGQSQVILYNAGAYLVFGDLGATRRQTASIAILPAPTASFAWQITEPITAGVPVDSPFTLTALDPFGNVDSLFVSRGDTVLLSSSGGAVSPSSLPPLSFSSGRASLSALNFTYDGSGGLVTFSAEAGMATGVSKPSDVQAFFVDSLVLNESLLRRGVDTLTGYFQVRVAGSGTATVTGLELLTSQGNFPLDSVQVTPPFPVGITGPGTANLGFRWPIPGSLAAGILDVTCAVFAQFPTASVTDSCPDSSSVILTTSSELGFVSLIPDTVAYDDVLYGLELTNTGPTSISIRLDSTHLILSNGPRSDTATAVLSGPLTIGPSDVVALDFAAVHATPFAGNVAVARLQYVGAELGHSIEGSVPFATPVVYAAPVNPSYLAGTLKPDTLVALRADTVRLRLSHGGGVTVFDAQTRPTWMELRGASDTLRVSLDTTITPLADWTPGDTTLAFPLTQADTRLVPGRYEVSVQISGRHNRLDTALTIVAGDPLLVTDAPSIRVNDVRVLAPRVPQVSVGQDFIIEADVENTGEEALDSVQLRLTSDDSSVFIDTLTLGSILTNVTQSVQWSVTAHTDSVILETFRVEITNAWGRNSGTSATVLPPLVDFTSIQIQTKADVSVHSRILDPSDALDGRVAAGSPFTVAGLFLNSGQAITSSAELLIRVTGGLQLNSSDTITLVPVGKDAQWSITAPDFDTTAQVIIELLTPPQELNTGDPAGVKSGSDTINIEVVFEAPPLRVTNVQSSGGAVSGPYMPLEWQWSNEDLTGLFPILVQNLELEAVGIDGITPLAVTDIRCHLVWIVCVVFCLAIPSR